MIGREVQGGNSWNGSRICNQLEIIKSSCKELPRLLVRLEGESGV